MTNNKLKGFAAERGRSEDWYVTWVVVPLVNKFGQAEAARKIGVSQATISNWLKGKYIMKPYWIPKTPPNNGVRSQVDVLAEHAEQELERN